MKNYLLFFSCLLLLIISCKTQEKSDMQPMSITDEEKAVAMANDTVRIANDELEYEIIIIDPGFNSWLYSRARPRGYYNLQYFETKNKLWVTQWNIRAMQPQRYGDLYLMAIDYEPHIDYGYEVNYMLYNYLVYFQLTTGERLGGIVPQF
ncbi:DUF6146 family protein [Flavobacterium beibuense]|uniref:Putative lipoprotein n=1 Tax=Flavobacterium beibuense TaxID=657326 RepID=A0A444WGG1_9FLAO|nr:DUF6146 family protein [Flavobacterium beibuense]RYJ44940.1 putative lipoprotein [Flavobacterium beibuense]